MSRIQVKNVEEILLKNHLKKRKEKLEKILNNITNEKVPGN